MDLIKGYEEPDLNSMSQRQLIGLVHRVIALLRKDKDLAEDVFDYSPREMETFIREIEQTLHKIYRSKPYMIELVEALYGDPKLRELYATNTNGYSRQFHSAKRRKLGGGRTRRQRRKGSRRR